MIIGLFGLLSGGKSVSAVKLIKDYEKEGKRVISNTPLFHMEHLYLPNVKFIEFLKENLEKDENLEKVFSNSVFFIDEITNLVDARRSGSALNELITGFMMMLGKLDCDVIYTCQILESQVDLRLREITNVLINAIRIDIDGNPLVFDKRILEKDVYIYLEYKFILGPLGEKIAREIYNPAEFYKFFWTRKIILLDRDKYLKKK